MSDKRDKPDEYLNAAAAAKRVPTRPHRSVVWRWMTTGLKGIRLEHIRMGGQLVTTQRWIDEFFTKLTNAGLKDDLPLPKSSCRIPSERQRKREADIARRKLLAS